MNKLLIFIVAVMSIISSVLISVNERARTAISQRNITICFSDLSDISTCKLKFSIHNSVPVYENGEIIQYNHYYLKSAEVQNDKIAIDVDGPALLKLDLSSIPSGYGATKQFFLIYENDTNIEICLKEITEVKYHNGSLAVFDKNGKELFANSGIKETNSSYICLANGKRFLIEKEKHTASDSCDKEDTKYQDNDRGLFTAEIQCSVSYSNIGSVSSNDGSVKVYYDQSGMQQSVATSVASRLVDIISFFCSASGLNFTRPYTNSDGEYKVYLEYSSNINGEPGVTNSDECAGMFGANRGRYSVTKLSYELASATLNGTYTYSYAMALAHEYFHAILDKYGVIFQNPSETYWFHEAMAEMAGVLYINYLANNANYIDPYISNELTVNCRTYARSIYRSLSSTTDAEEPYSRFAFMLYLYQEYGLSAIKSIIQQAASQAPLSAIASYLSNNTNEGISDAFYNYSADSLYLPDCFNGLINTNYLSAWTYRYAVYSETNSFYIQYATQKSDSLIINYLGSRYLYFVHDSLNTYNMAMTFSCNDFNYIRIAKLRITPSGNRYLNEVNIPANVSSVTVLQGNFGNYTCEQLCFAIVNTSFITNDYNFVNYDVEFSS